MDTHTPASTHALEAALLPERDGPAPDTSGEEQRDGGGKFDALLALAGTGKDIWGDEGADEYVRRLREGWD